MKIKYLGHSCFLLTTNSGVTILTDPYAGVGYELPADLEADIVTVSHGHFDHAYTDGVQANSILTDSQETVLKTEKGDLRIYGIDCYHDPKQGALRGSNIIFIFEADGVRLCHMGDIGEECTEALAQKIGKVDALLIPVGGKYTVDALGAKRYADALAPRWIIPMHYRPTDGSLDITDCQPFLSLYRQEEIVVIDGECVLEECTSLVIYMQRVK